MFRISVFFPIFVNLKYVCCPLLGPLNGEDLRPLRNGAGHLEQCPGRLRLTCHGAAGDHQTWEVRDGRMRYLWWGLMYEV